MRPEPHYRKPTRRGAARQRLFPLAGGILFLVTLFSADHAFADGFPVTQVIEAIKAEINQARQAKSPQDAGLEIASVDVELTAVAKVDAGGGVTLEIPVVGDLVGKAGVGADINRADSQKIKLTLTPSGGPIQISGSENLGLVPAVESAKAAVRMAERGPIKFGISSFSFEAQCAVTRSAEGGVKFVFLDAKTSAQDVATQKITFHMIVRGQP